MRQLYHSLRAYSLDPEWNRRTCNYWYLVHANVSQSHTAFHTHAGLVKWLEERGLSLASELPKHATHGQALIAGEYREEMHMSYDEFYSLDGVILDTRDLSNGQYTLARITLDPDELRTAHTLNPNCRYRPVFDYETCRAAHK